VERITAEPRAQLEEKLKEVEERSIGVAEADWLGITPKKVTDSNWVYSMIP
jgi:hypothetical protein